MATGILGSDLVQKICCNCGIAFGFPNTFYHACKADENKWFYCPNGHRQHYIESEATRLKRELEREQSNRKFYEKRFGEVLKECDAASRQLKGAKTRMRNLKTRVANGVCPCCNRQFKSLHRHMSHMHPGYKPAGDE